LFAVVVVAVVVVTSAALSPGTDAAVVGVEDATGDTADGAAVVEGEVDTDCSAVGVDASAGSDSTNGSGIGSLTGRGVGVSPRKIENVSTSATTITATNGSRLDSKFDGLDDCAIKPRLTSVAGGADGITGAGCDSLDWFPSCEGSCTSGSNSARLIPKTSAYLRAASRLCLAP
jgi:hypothetical protein